MLTETPIKQVLLLVFLCGFSAALLQTFQVFCVSMQLFLVVFWIDRGFVCYIQNTALKL